MKMFCVDRCGCQTMKSPRDRCHCGCHAKWLKMAAHREEQQRLARIRNGMRTRSEVLPGFYPDEVGKTVAATPRWWSRRLKLLK